MYNKKVMVDTNCLMNNFNLEEYEKVFLCLPVLEELDKHKSSSDSDRAYKSRQALRKLENACNVEYLIDTSFILDKFLDDTRYDNKILGFAKQLYLSDNEIILLSGDKNMLEKAKCLKIPCEKWESENDSCDVLYTGIKYVEVTEDADSIEDILKTVNINDLVENQYILIGFWENNDKYEQEQFQTVKAFRWSNGLFEDTKTPRLGDKLNDCFRDNAEQRLIYDALNDDNIDILVVYGSAGSGKDFSVLANCLNNISKPSKNKRGMYKSKSIIYTRSTVEAGQKQGFLPGTAEEKSSIYMLPARQNINKIYEIIGIDSDYNSLIDAKMYEEVPLAYMRGCTYNDTYMILDESANSSLEEVKMFISRAGEGSKVIILGSLNQIDNKCNSYTNNALFKVINAYKGQKNCAIIELRNQHRSLLALQADKLLN